jgi:substrate import-associated zinc metallohydrolase lipoprotein
MKTNYYILFLFLSLFSCENKEDLNYHKRVIEESNNPTQKYINENFIKKYNTSVIWKWEDNYVSQYFYVTPPRTETVIPALEMVRDFWIQPYELMSEGSKKFIRSTFPPEIVLIGSKIYNEDGTETLGFAEAGVRITLSETDALDLSNFKWLKRQLHTIHHEFSHIVHQTFNLPTGYELITGSKYTGKSWTTLVNYTNPDDNSNAIKLGCVTAYGTNNEFEDFCELVSTFLISKKADFENEYFSKTNSEIDTEYKDSLKVLLTNMEERARTKTEEFARNAGFSEQLISLKGDSAVAKVLKDSTQFAADMATNFKLNLSSLNEGKKLIENKLQKTIDYYKDNFDLPLGTLRDTIQARITKVTTK